MKRGAVKFSTGKLLSPYVIVVLEAIYLPVSLLILGFWGFRTFEYYLTIFATYPFLLVLLPIFGVGGFIIEHSYRYANSLTKRSRNLFLALIYLELFFFTLGAICIGLIFDALLKSTLINYYPFTLWTLFWVSATSIIYMLKGKINRNQSCETFSVKNQIS